MSDLLDYAKAFFRGAPPRPNAIEHDEQQKKLGDTVKALNEAVTRLDRALVGRTLAFGTPSRVKNKDNGGNGRYAGSPGDSCADAPLPRVVDD